MQIDEHQHGAVTVLKPIGPLCEDDAEALKTRTLEAYELADAEWTVLNVFRDDDTVSVAPFDAIVIRLADLWG